MPAAMSKKAAQIEATGDKYFQMGTASELSGKRQEAFEFYKTAARGYNNKALKANAYKAAGRVSRELFDERRRLWDIIRTEMDAVDAARGAIANYQAANVSYQLAQPPSEGGYKRKEEELKDIEIRFKEVLNAVIEKADGLVKQYERGNNKGSVENPIIAPNLPTALAWLTQALRYYGIVYNEYTLGYDVHEMSKRGITLLGVERLTEVKLKIGKAVTYLQEAVPAAS